LEGCVLIWTVVAATTESKENLMAQLSRRTLLLGGAAAATVGGIPPGGAGAEDQARAALPIPPELRAGASGTIALDLRPGSMRFQGGKDTATYGVNGPYLGPAVR
jgi:blue copper oxidase